MKQKILIVDDHELTRAGLGLILSEHPEFEIVKFLTDGTSVIQCIKSESIDIVFLDIELPDISGVNLLAELVGIYDMTVIILTGRQNAKEFDFVLKMGARAVISKGDDTISIMDGLESVLRGEIYLSPRVEKILKDYEKPKVNLSPRQMVILNFLALNETNKEIGYRLNIAAPTVSFHLAELRRKLGAENNRKIVPEAIAQGIL